MTASGEGGSGKLEYDNNFWRFSLAVYDEPGVAEECLALQQAAGIDVNLLLFCAWTGAQGIVLSSEDIEAALRRVAAWQERVVRQLRTARQQIKALGYDEFEGFRSRIKSIEIDAEQIEQAMLFAYFREIQTACAGSDRRNAVMQNLRKYIDMAFRTQPQLNKDFSTALLADAAMRARS